MQSTRHYKNFTRVRIAYIGQQIRKIYIPTEVPNLPSNNRAMILSIFNLSVSAIPMEKGGND